MSRIAAIFDFTGGNLPDHQAFGGAAIGGIWQEEHAVLAFSPTSQGQEEYPSPRTRAHAGIAIVLDGYLANDEELRRDLEERGHPCHGESDQELLARAYGEWGDDFLCHAEGEFALILWDSTKQRALLARDQQGLRPLFYHRDRSRIIVASDFATIHALTSQDLALETSVLVQLMAHQACWEDETIWQGIRRVLPAHIVSITPDTVRTAPYWSPPPAYSIRYAKDREYAEHYAHILSESVRKASRSKGKIGIEVSGGLDSSAIFAVADQLQRRNALRAPDIAGYSLFGPEGTDAHESHHALAVARKLGRDLKGIDLERPPLEWYADDAKRAFDLPFYPNAAMAMEMYRLMAADGCTVALSGLGGDENLNGRVTLFHQSLRHADFPLLTRSFLAVAQDFGLANAVKALARFGIAPFVSGALRRDERTSARREVAWLSREAQAELDAARQAARSRSKSAQLRGFLPSMTTMVLEQKARMLEMSGIEGRHPMHLRNFVEFASALPDGMRLRGRFQKHVHRQALHDLLPASVLQRTDKAEFSTVFDGLDSGLQSRIAALRGPGFDRLVCDDALADLLSPQIPERRVDGLWGWQVWAVLSVATILRNAAKD